MIDYLLKLGIFERLTYVDSMAMTKLNEQREERKKLDQRLNRLTKATVENSSGYILKLVKANPECAVDIIKDCDTKGGD